MLLLFLLAASAHISGSASISLDVAKHYHRHLVGSKGKNCQIVAAVDDAKFQFGKHELWQEDGLLYTTMKSVGQLDMSTLDKIALKTRQTTSCSILLGTVENKEEFKKLLKFGKSLRVATVISVGIDALTVLDQSFTYEAVLVSIHFLTTNPLVKISGFCPLEWKPTDQSIHRISLATEQVSVEKLNQLIQSLSRCKTTLEGRQLLIGDLGTVPYIIIDEHGNNVGVDADLLRMLSSALGYSYTAKLYRTFDHRNKTGHWLGRSADIMSGKLDVGISFVGYIQPLMSKLDYTNFVYYNVVGFSTCLPRPKSPFFSLLRPFDLTVWSLTMASILGTAMGFAIIYLGTKLSGHEEDLKQVEDYFSFIIGTLAIFIEFHDLTYFKSTAKYRLSEKILRVAWIMGGMLITFAFLSNLRAHLITPVLTKPLDTTQDILDEGFTVYSPVGSPPTRYLQTTQVKNHQKIYEQTVKNNGLYRYAKGGGSPLELKERMRNCDGVVQIDTYMTNKRPGIHPSLKTHFGKEMFYFTYSGLMLQRDSIWLSIFNRAISRAHSAGLVDFHLLKPRKYDDKIREGTFIMSEMSNDTKINMENVALIFMVLLIGFVLSAIAFVGEMRQPLNKNNVKMLNMGL